MLDFGIFFKVCRTRCVYIYHKTEFGFVDLTFESCADKIVDIELMLEDTLGDYLGNGFTVQRTGKSAAVRLLVPILDLHQSFEEQQKAVDAGIDAVRRMSELVKQFDPQIVAALFDYFVNK